MDQIILVLQGILAMMMLTTGLLKLATNREQFKALGKGNLDWADSLTVPRLKLIGLFEFMIGIGLFLPQLLEIQIWLVPMAAIGTIFTMIGAFILHIKRKDDFQALATNVAILLIASFILISRVDSFSSL